MTDIIKRSVLAGIVLFSVLTSSHAQSLLNDWQVKIGLNVANPSIIRDNDAYAPSPLLGWQFGLGKVLPITHHIAVQLSGGYMKLNFDAGEASRLSSIGESATMSYGFLDAGIRGEKALKKVTPFAIVAMRGSHLLQDNLNDLFFLPFRDTFDYGLAFSVGSHYQMDNLWPFIEIGYYYGLLNITPNSTIDGYGQSHYNELINRYFSIQIGVQFK